MPDDSGEGGQQGQLRAFNEQLQRVIRASGEFLGMIADEEYLYQRILGEAIKMIPGAQKGTLQIREGDYLEYRAAEGYPLKSLVKTPYSLENEKQLQTALSFLLGESRLKEIISNADDIAMATARLIEEGVVLRFSGTEVRRFLTASFPESYIKRLTSDVILDDIHSVLIVPLQLGLSLSGLICLVNEESESAFSGQDVETMRLYGRIVSELLENLHLQKRLGSSELKYRDLIESIPDYIYNVTVEKGQVKERYFSPVVENILGYTPDELAKYAGNIHHLILPEDRDIPVKAAQDLVGGKAKQVTVEYRIHHKDGRIRWVRDNMRLTAIPAHHTYQFFGVVSDVSRRHLMKQELTLKLGELDAVFNAIPHQIALHDKDLRLLRVNQKLADDYHLPREQLEGRYCYEVIHGKDDICQDCMVQKAIDEGQPQRSRIRNKEGRTLDVSVFPLKDEQDNVRGAVEFMQDVSEYEKATQELKESEERYRQLITHMPIGMVVEQDGKIAFANPAAAKIMGFESPEQMIDTPRQILVHPDNKTETEANVKALYQTLVPQGPVEIRAKSPDGRDVWVMVMSVPFIYNSRPAALAMFQDISERYQMQEQLVTAQKMQVLGTMAGGIAHDFNNLIGGIMGNLSLIEVKLGQDERVKKNLEAIGLAAQRAAELTQGLLTFGRKEPLRLVSTNLNDLVLEDQKLLLETFPQNIVIDLRLEQNLDPVNADPTQIQQVLVNLCLNARDAMPRGGKLIIHTANRVLGGKDIAANIEARAGRFVELSVTDTGLGIEPAVLPKIFEPFFSTKRSINNAGLGLSIVYGIVKNHQGWITAESEKNKGAKFSVLLPALSEKALKKRDADPRDELSSGRETILAVDDEPKILETIYNLLSTLGYTVLKARDGETACQILKTQLKNIQAVILDQTMPGKSGEETLAEMQKMKPDIKMLLISGYSIHDLSQSLLVPGQVEFLQKPYRLEDLARALRDLLDGK